jgi:LysM repeat protein
LLPLGSKEEEHKVRTNTGEDIRILRGDILRLREDVNTLAAQFDRLSAVQEREITAMKAAVNGMDNQVTQATTSILTEVDRKIAELDAKRVADKNQLVAKMNSAIEQLNDLSQKVRAIPPPRSGSGETVTETGFYYTVEDRDTLWGIASKYKQYAVTVDAIRRANNMDPASNRIVPGQKLFIPAKE